MGWTEVSGLKNLKSLYILPLPLYVYRKKVDIKNLNALMLFNVLMDYLARIFLNISYIEQLNSEQSFLDNL
jgi:hypothetical protein